MMEALLVISLDVGGTEALARKSVEKGIWLTCYTYPLNYCSVFSNTSDS